jgi:hypothetical protein
VAVFALSPKVVYLDEKGLISIIWVRKLVRPSMFVCKERARTETEATVIKKILQLSA